MVNNWNKSRIGGKDGKHLNSTCKYLVPSYGILVGCSSWSIQFLICNNFQFCKFGIQVVYFMKTGYWCQNLIFFATIEKQSRYASLLFFLWVLSFFSWHVWCSDTQPQQWLQAASHESATTEGKHQFSLFFNVNRNSKEYPECLCSDWETKNKQALHTPLQLTQVAGMINFYYEIHCWLQVNWGQFGPHWVNGVEYNRAGMSCLEVWQLFWNWQIKMLKLWSTLWKQEHETQLETSWSPRKSITAHLKHIKHQWDFIWQYFMKMHQLLSQ